MHLACEVPALRGLRPASVQSTFAGGVIPIIVEPCRRGRFIVDRCSQDSCDPSVGFCKVLVLPGRWMQIRLLHNCWEQPLYPINGSGLLGDFSPGIVTYSQGQLPSCRPSAHNLVFCSYVDSRRGAPHPTDVCQQAHNTDGGLSSRGGSGARGRQFSTTPARCF